MYALTAAGRLGFIDTVEVRYNKSQAKIRPIAIRQLSLQGALPYWVIPGPGSSFNEVLVGQEDATIKSYVNTQASVSTGAQTLNLEFFVPLNLVHPADARGILPLMAGDTGIQVIVNTPQSLYPTGVDTANYGDAILNSFTSVSGTGHAVSGVGGTVSVYAVYRDGDCLSQLAKKPFDISLLDGTFQMQIDQQLNPWVAGSYQRTKLNIMGKHMYVLLLCVDGNSATAMSARSNIAYLESSKDATGSNVFWKYGTQTNLSEYESDVLQRLGRGQDLDPGAIMMVRAPVDQVGQNTSYVWDEVVNNYLDNTRTGWADWRYCVTPTTVSSSMGAVPRIEPHLFYVNPTGLVPV